MEVIAITRVCDIASNNKVPGILLLEDDQLTSKDTQELARHSTTRLTLDVYGRADNARIARAIERLDERVRPPVPATDNTIIMQKMAVGTKYKSASPQKIKDLRFSKMVEAAGIEPASETKSAKIYYVRSRSLEVSSSALSTDGATHRNQLSKVSSAPPERELGQSCKNWHRGPPRRLNRPQWATLIA